MFAHDICHSQIEYVSLRLVGVVRLRLGERYHKSSIVNIQFRLVRVRYYPGI
jgi:hypothetical protein